MAHTAYSTIITISYLKYIVTRQKYSYEYINLERYIVIMARLVSILQNCFIQFGLSTGILVEVLKYPIQPGN